MGAGVELFQNIIQYVDGVVKAQAVDQRTRDIYAVLLKSGYHSSQLPAHEDVTKKLDNPEGSQEFADRLGLAGLTITFNQGEIYSDIEDYQIRAFFQIKSNPLAPALMFGKQIGDIILNTKDYETNYKPKTQGVRNSSDSFQITFERTGPVLPGEQPSKGMVAVYSHGLVYVRKSDALDRMGKPVLDAVVEDLMHKAKTGARLPG